MSNLQEFLNSYPEEYEDFTGYFDHLYEFKFDGNGNLIIQTPERYDDRVCIFIDGRMDYEHFDDFKEDVKMHFEQLSEQLESEVNYIEDYEFIPEITEPRKRKKINYAPNDEIDY